MSPSRIVARALIELAGNLAVVGLVTYVIVAVARCAWH